MLVKNRFLNSTLILFITETAEVKVCEMLKHEDFPLPIQFTVCTHNTNPYETKALEGTVCYPDIE